MSVLSGDVSQILGAHDLAHTTVRAKLAECDSDSGPGPPTLMDKLMEVPRLEQAFETSTIDAAVESAFNTLGYERPTDDQVKVIRAFLSGKDVFVMLPTGSGKSLCFVALPLVFDYLRRVAQAKKCHNSIVVVVSPLTALIKDQVAKYGRAVTCAYLKDEIDINFRESLYRGDFQLIYSSPEALLTVHQWRKMLSSNVYQENIVALAVDEAHCISTW